MDSLFRDTAPGEFCQIPAFHWINFAPFQFLIGFIDY